jgi:hypothetical protein
LDEAVQSVERERRSKLLVKSKYETIAIDPFALFEVDGRPGRWGGTPPTEKQLSVLADNGLKFTTGGIDRGQASALIDRIIKRREQGLCTPKQARLLARYGISADLSFDDASKVITAIAKNRWNLPAQFESKQGSTQGILETKVQ